MGNKCRKSNVREPKRRRQETVEERPKDVEEEVVTTVTTTKAVEMLDDDIKSPADDLDKIEIDNDIEKRDKEAVENAEDDDLFNVPDAFDVNEKKEEKEELVSLNEKNELEPLNEEALLIPVPADKNRRSVEKYVGSAEKDVGSAEKDVGFASAAFSAKSAAAASESPVSPAESPVLPTESPVSPAKYPVSSAESPVSPAKYPISSAESPVSPAKYPISSAESPAPCSTSLFLPTNVNDRLLSVDVSGDAEDTRRTSKSSRLSFSAFSPTAVPRPYISSARPSDSGIPSLTPPPLVFNDATTASIVTIPSDENIALLGEQMSPIEKLKKAEEDVSFSPSDLSTRGTPRANIELIADADEALMHKKQFDFDSEEKITRHMYTDKIKSEIPNIIIDWSAVQHAIDKVSVMGGCFFEDLHNTKTCNICKCYDWTDRLKLKGALKFNGSGIMADSII